MKIIFFGTPEFALPSLETIFKSNYIIEAIVTAPDKIRGRGGKSSFTPVKEFAIKNNIPVLQPDKMNDPDFIEKLRIYKVDLFIVVAFRILPKSVFTIPSKGTFNLHGSILPKYRGAAPIQWSLINGDKKTGLTTFFIDEKVDTGNIIIKRELDINDDDDYGTLQNRMSLIGADVLMKTIGIIESGKYSLTKQNDNEASPAPKITKEMCRIDWHNEADKIKNLIRGLSPKPGAFFIFNEKVIKIYRSEISENHHLLPGEIYNTKTEIFIGCSDFALQILDLQLEGRKRMKADEFLRGFNFSGVIN